MGRFVHAMAYCQCRRDRAWALRLTEMRCSAATNAIWSRVHSLPDLRPNPTVDRSERVRCLYSAGASLGLAPEIAEGSVITAAQIKAAVQARIRNKRSKPQLARIQAMKGTEDAMTVIVIV